MDPGELQHRGVHYEARIERAQNDVGDPHPHASARSEVAELTGELVRGLTHFCFLATIDLRSNRSTSLRTLRKVLEIEKSLDPRHKDQASYQR